MEAGLIGFLMKSKSNYTMIDAARNVPAGYKPLEGVGVQRSAGSGDYRGATDGDGE